MLARISDVSTLAGAALIDLLAYVFSGHQRCCLARAAVAERYEVKGTLGFWPTCCAIRASTQSSHPQRLGA